MLSLILFMADGFSFILKNDKKLTIKKKEGSFEIVRDEKLEKARQHNVVSIELRVESTLWKWIKLCRSFMNMVISPC